MICFFIQTVCVPPLGVMLATVPVSDGDRLRLWGLSKPLAISRVWLRGTAPRIIQPPCFLTQWLLPQAQMSLRVTHCGAFSSLRLEPESSEAQG